MAFCPCTVLCYEITYRNVYLSNLLVLVLVYEYNSRIKIQVYRHDDSKWKVVVVYMYIHCKRDPYRTIIIRSRL